MIESSSVNCYGMIVCYNLHQLALLGLALIIDLMVRDSRYAADARAYLCICKWKHISMHVYVKNQAT